MQLELLQKFKLSLWKSTYMALSHVLVGGNPSALSYHIFGLGGNLYCHITYVSSENLSTSDVLASRKSIYIAISHDLVGRKSICTLPFHMSRLTGNLPYYWPWLEEYVSTLLYHMFWFRESIYIALLLVWVGRKSIYTALSQYHMSELGGNLSALPYHSITCLSWEEIYLHCPITVLHVWVGRKPIYTALSQYHMSALI